MSSFPTGIADCPLNTSTQRFLHASNMNRQNHYLLFPPPPTSFVLLFCSAYASPVMFNQNINPAGSSSRVLQCTLSFLMSSYQFMEFYSPTCVLLSDEPFNHSQKNPLDQNTLPPPPPPPLKTHQWPSNQEKSTHSLAWHPRLFVIWAPLLLPVSSPRASPPKASAPVRTLTQYACIDSIHRASAEGPL